MKVLVNGIGNIGTTLSCLLQDYKTELGISEVYALKNTLNPWSHVDLELLQNKGINIYTHQTDNQYQPVEDIAHQIEYIFDCQANTYGLKNKTWYQTLNQLKGCSAQGSEKGFGIPYMTGINDEIIIGEKFVQIVSCNTHALASLLTTFAQPDLSQLKEADFVIVRRSEDLGNHQRLVSANVVARHLNDQIGTHHSIDVKDLFATLHKEVQVQSSDITTPSQLMHAVRFNITLKEPLNRQQVNHLLAEQSYISTSTKFDSNVIFELGRRYSPYGRIYSQAIVVDNNLLLTDYGVKGWAFIPQEGNTILSTLHAFLLQTNHLEANTIIQRLSRELIQKVW